MQETKGTCQKHGEFNLRDGCKQCLEERQAGQAEASKETPQYIVQVRYGAEATEGRLYSYYSVDDLQVGDLVEVPTKNGLVKARVLTTGVTEAEVASFKHAMRTIPAGSVIHEKLTTEEKLDDLDRMVNLCDTCKSRQEYPMCSPGDVEFGDGKGTDNIISCSKYEIRPELEEMEEGLNAEGLTLAGAEDPAAETALAKAPGADVQVMGYFNEAMKLLEYAEGRVIATVEDVKTATDDLSIIAKLKKAMEGKKREYLNPLKAKADAIRETYSSLMDPVFRADKITKDKMLAFDKEQKRIRAEEEDINRKRREAAEAEKRLKGETTEPVNLVEVTPPAAKSVSTGMGTAGMVDRWKYEVVDFALLPDEYKVADGSMLTAVARKHHDQKPVPGVRFYNEPIIAVRAR